MDNKFAHSWYSADWTKFADMETESGFISENTLRNLVRDGIKRKGGLDITSNGVTIGYMSNFTENEDGSIHVDIELLKEYANDLLNINKAFKESE